MSAVRLGSCKQSVQGGLEKGFSDAFKCVLARARRYPCCSSLPALQPLQSLPRVAPRARKAVAGGPGCDGWGPAEGDPQGIRAAALLAPQGPPVTAWRTREPVRSRRPWPSVGRKVRTMAVVVPVRALWPVAGRLRGDACTPHLKAGPWYSADGELNKPLTSLIRARFNIPAVTVGTIPPSARTCYHAAPAPMPTTGTM